MSEGVFYEVAKLDGTPPFAVISIHPDRYAAGGCIGIIESFHDDRADAELAAEAFRKGTQ